MPTVSVAILSHNAAAYIAAALDSALAQTHALAQILVIDDSTDDSPAIVERYAIAHPGVVQLMRVLPCNVSKARNMALQNMTGEYASFLDADDIWLPRKTELQLAALAQTPDAVGAYAHYFDFRVDLDDGGRKVPKQGQDDPSLRDVIYLQNMSSSTILFRRSAAAGLQFDEKRKDAEDTLFVAELRLKGRWRLADEALIAKRIHGNQASVSLKHVVRNVECRLSWLKERRDAAAAGGFDAGAIHDEIASAWMGDLEGHYWRRDIANLKWMLAEARRICPEYVARSFLDKARLYPRWVYRLRDLVAGKK